MQFDQDSIAHLMAVLTDLYSDPELAVIREYSANALDSHVAAGITDPIEISLPTDLYPIFTVQDHGVGLSLDEVNNHLSKYGWSSKRDNNDEVGMLGLGFKSALTYTSQFTVVAVKDGMAATVLITREATGQGAIQTIAHEPTEDRNGVTVQVPVKHPRLFNNRAAKFFRFWDKGLVLVDGAEPASIWDLHDQQFMTLDPDVLLLRGNPNTVQSDYFVMGNVAYPLDHGKGRLVTGSDNVYAVCRIPMGLVTFTPSREALQYTKKTLDVVESAREFISGQIGRKAMDEVEKATSYIDAMNLALKWRSTWRGVYKYKGLVVPNEFDTTYPGETYGTGYYKQNACAFYFHSSNPTDTPAERRQSLNVKDAIEAVHVTGFTGKYVTGLTKEKVKIWAREHDYPTGARFYFHRQADWGQPWLKSRTVPWEVLNAVVVPHDKPTRTKPAKDALPFRVVTSYGGMEYVPNVPTGEIVWEMTTDHNVDSRHYIHRKLVDFGLMEKISYVTVNKGQEARFKREFPQAIHIAPWMKGILACWVKGLTPVDLTFLNDAATVNESGILTLDPAKVDDPVLRDFITRFKGANKNIEHHYQSLVELKTYILGRYNFPKPSAPTSVSDALYKYITARYPLLPLLTQRGYIHWGDKRGYREIVTPQVIAEYLRTQYIIHEQLHLITVL